MRLDDAVTFFLSEWPEAGPRRPSPETVRTYGWQLKWLVGYAARRRKTRLSDLDTAFVREAMAEKESGTTAHPRTHKGGEAAANSLACAARAMARWLLAQGVPVASLESIRPPRVPERLQVRVREEEFAALQTAILRRLVSGDRRNARATVARDLALIHLMADTGLRAAELCKMTLDSIDFSTGSVLVFRGKFSKPRALSILGDPETDADPELTLRLLRDWMQLRPSIHGAAAHQWLWVNTRGEAVTPAGLRKLLATMCAEAGIEGNRPPHTFRRAAFTEAYLDDPRNVNVLSARMGWSPRSRDMVDVYTRGAEIDFARTNPLPSLSARWGQANVTRMQPSFGRLSPVRAYNQSRAGPARSGYEVPEPPPVDEWTAPNAKTRTSRSRRSHTT